MTAATALYRPTTRDTKTGDIPVSYIGKTYAELLETCGACPLLTKVRRPESTGKRIRQFGFGCYFHFGNARAGYLHMVRRYLQKPYEYTLTWALSHRTYHARAFRASPSAAIHPAWVHSSSGMSPRSAKPGSRSWRTRPSGSTIPS